MSKVCQIEENCESHASLHNSGVSYSYIKRSAGLLPLNIIGRFLPFPVCSDIGLAVTRYLGNPAYFRI